MVSELTSFGPISMATTPDAALHEILQCLQDLRRCLKNPAPISKTTANPDSFDATMTNPVPISSPLLPKPPDPPDFEISAPFLSNPTFKTGKNKVPRKYSCAKVYEKMENGLCLFCDEPDIAGHHLKHKNPHIFMFECDDDQLCAENELVEPVVAKDSSLHHPLECVPDLQVFVTEIDDERDADTDEVAVSLENNSELSNCDELFPLPLIFPPDSPTFEIELSVGNEMVAADAIENEDSRLEKESRRVSYVPLGSVFLTEESKENSSDYFELSLIKSPKVVELSCPQYPRSSRSVWEPGGISASNRDIKFLRRVHKISFQQISQETSHAKIGIQIAESHSYPLVHPTLESHTLLLVSGHLTMQKFSSVKEISVVSPKGTSVTGFSGLRYMILRVRTAGKDLLLLTKKESEIPKVLGVGHGEWWFTLVLAAFSRYSGFDWLLRFICNKALKESKPARIQEHFERDNDKEGREKLQVLRKEIIVSLDTTHMARSCSLHAKSCREMKRKTQTVLKTRHTKLCKRFKEKYLEFEDHVRRVAPLLLSAIHKVHVSTKSLSTLHPDCLQICLQANYYEVGFFILSDEIFEVEQSRDFLLYCYYHMLCTFDRGMICNGLKRFHKALELLYNVVTAPLHLVNAIALERTKVMHATQAVSDLVMLGLLGSDSWTLNEVVFSGYIMHWRVPFSLQGLLQASFPHKDRRQWLVQILPQHAHDRLKKHKLIKTWKFKYKPDFLLRVLMNAEQEQSSDYGDVKQLICGSMKYHMKHKWRPKQLQADSDFRTKHSSKDIETSCALLGLGLNEDAHKLPYFVKGYGDKDIMKLRVVGFHSISLMLFYGSLPRPPDFRTIKKSLERLSTHKKDHKLLFPRNHKLLHPGAVFWTKYNDVEQLSIELQSSPGLNYFTHLVFLQNQALICGCKVDHLSSGIFSVDSVYEIDNGSKLQIGNVTQDKMLLYRTEVSPLLDNANEADLVINGNWFHNCPTIEEVFHLLRPP